MRTDSWILLAFTGALVVAVLICGAVDFFVSTRRSRVTQRWVAATAPTAEPRLVAHVDRILATRGLVGSVGGLIGWVLGGPVVAVRLIRGAGDPTPTLGLAPIIGFVLGEFVARAAYTVLQLRTVKSPSGRRVSLSRRPQLGWFLSPGYCAIALLGVAVVITLGVIRLRQFRDGVLPVSPTTSVLGLALLVEIVLVIVPVIAVPWVIRHPLPGPDEDWLRAGLTLRQSDVGFLVTLPYPLIMNLAYTLASGPSDNRQGWPELPMGLLLPAASTFLILAVFSAPRDSVADRVLGPLPKADTPDQVNVTPLPAEWEPAPGTNGWILPGRSRTSA